MSYESDSTEATKFTELLHENRSRVFGYIYALVHNQADAEELFQETAVRLWQKFSEYDESRDFGHWAVRFAHLTVLNFIRVNRRRRVFFSEGLLERMAEVHVREATDLSQARTDALAHCLEHLPTKDQQLVEACYSRNLTMKQAALELGRSANAIYHSIGRVRRSLLTCIERTLAKEC